MEPPDISQYEHYWTTEEKIPELDLSQSWTRQSMLHHVQEQLASFPPLLSRHFQLVSQGPPREESPSSIKVMQWNILAQALSLGKDNFIKCPVEALAWKTRKLRMLEEILTVDADVICLQEVDHFPFLKAVLGAIGYEGVFFPKPSSPCLYVPETSGPDGCAIFYKKDVVAVLKTDTQVLKTANSSNFTNQVCIILTLQINDGSPNKKTIAIATTHLKAKTGYHQLRHSQGCYLLDYLKKNYADVPFIICGDFNADPSEPVYEAFSKSSLNLESAYKKLSAGNEEAPFTTWKIRGSQDGSDVEVCKTIDYMWYTPSSVSVKTLMSLPSGEELGINRMPSFSYPSDHLALAAEFNVASI